MPRLIALKKISSRYPAGAEFEASERTARLLKAIGKAKDAPEDVPENNAGPDREVLRARAEQLGVEVDGRWGAPRLQEEITAVERAPERHAPRYGRRDMRAVDEEA